MSLQTCLAELANISAFFRDMLDSAFAQLCSSFVKNQVKGLLQPFASLKYTLTEVRALFISFLLTRVIDEVSHLQEEFAQLEANDPWLEMFLYNLDQVTATFKVRKVLPPSSVRS